MYTSAKKWEEVGASGCREQMAVFSHIPVLPEEVLRWILPHPGGRYLDCTLGQGELAARILEQSTPSGYLIGIDRDKEAIASAAERLKPYVSRTHLIYGNFRDVKGHLQAMGVSEVDGVVFDLGVSSAQLDRPERGFSFLANGPLDMRMDQTTGPTAADLVNELSETKLADVVYQYGEERYARRIARAVVGSRAHRRLQTTAELVSVIRQAVPAAYRHGRLHCATRTFQALRIAVNRELEGLDDAIRDAVDLLSSGGRLCVISFHSLEDRIAKQTLRSLSCGPQASLLRCTKKPLVPSETERRNNPRARSAKLRVAERLPSRRSP